MVQNELQTSVNAFRLIVADRDEGQLGKLASIPRYRRLQSLLSGEARSCYRKLHETIERLGFAMQLGQHRHLIDSLNSQLEENSLVSMTAASLNNSEACAAFAVYLTTLEQAYHWPRNVGVSISTPDTVEDHKLVIQILNQPQLRDLLRLVLGISTIDQEVQLPPEYVAQAALTLARSILDDIRLKRERGETVFRDTQDTVNLLYRTCRNEWNDQGYDSDSHKEFGRLHEVIRASGTQRRMQELLEESNGLLCLQAMPSLLENLPLTSSLLSNALTQLQFAVAVAREELFSVSVDEVIWGRAFANFSKAVGFSDMSAGGGDGPIFWMLDSLCGQTKPKSSAALPEELNFRSRFFPQNMRDLVHRMRGLPALREYCHSIEVPEDLRQSFKALERQRFELYNMHRKKAARIGVSLRAGQNGTSAGVSACAYASPERSLAKTLTSAVSARFGDDDDTLSIDAIAQPHSLMFDEDGNIYSARVRFRFSTPLVLGPGDTLLVSVQINGRWQTRTYSTTYTPNTSRPLENDPHEIVRTAEVYIRSKGEVSNYLCSQTQGCEVRVAVKPASHFRLSANTTQEETTVLIAQGGALGIFAAWLESQTWLVGKYVLIVAARKFSQLGFKNELLDLAATWKQSLQVTVVLSKPEKYNISLLHSSGIETYHGRVNQYLDDNNVINSFRAAYVCGTSSFGLEVARAMSRGQSASKSPKRLEPIITSHLPAIRLHVAPEPQVMKDLPMITAAELAQHNSPSDLWIALGDNVYDITALSKFHPGGEKILLARAGRRADDIFESVHGGSVDVQSLLENMIVGQLASPNLSHSAWDERLDRIVEIQNDLTNHTRFESIPTDSDDDVCGASPTHVIYASLECFARDWCQLLEDAGLSKSIQCKLMRSCFGVIKELDNRQAVAYSDSIEDIQRCCQVLQQVFGKLRTIAFEIHTELDVFKADIARRLSENDVVDDGVLEHYTNRIITAIHC